MLPVSSISEVRKQSEDYMKTYDNYDAFINSSFEVVYRYSTDVGFVTQAKI
jgi:hypothetical protein